VASRRLLLGAGILGLQVAVFWLTTYVPGLGAQGWHHVASLAAVVALTAAAWRPLTRSRRVLAIGVLVFTVLATATGFWLLYWKEGIRVAGFQDWGVFWHVAWSWGAMVFFFQHTWINRVALGHFFRRSFARIPSAVLHAGAYAMLVVVFIVTWSSLGKGWFTVESYVPLSLYAWVLMVTPPYAAWAVTAVRGARVRAAARMRARQGHRRGTVDLALVPAAALAVVSGVSITWFDPAMDAHGWKYVSKFWHVWPSILFTVLVFIHTVQLWSAMRAHWRNTGMALGDVPPRAPRRGLAGGPAVARETAETR
jgi:hypothetical protein